MYIPIYIFTHMCAALGVAAWGVFKGFSVSAGSIRPDYVYSCHIYSRVWFGHSEPQLGKYRLQ